MRKYILILFITTLFLALLQTNIAWGQATIQWNGNGHGIGTSWNKAQNWSPPQIPTVNDDVVINDPDICEIDVNAVCRSLTLTNANLTFVGNYNLTVGDGGVIISSLSTLDLTNGNGMYVAGSWSHTLGGTGTFTPSTVTVTFNGSSSQSISSETFYDLAINNTSGGVSLNGPVTVNGPLTLTDGIITTNSSNLITLSSTATVSGGSSSSFVNGPLAISGTGDKTFPIGKGAAYRPIILNSVSGSPAPVISVEVFNSSSGGSAGTGINNISTVRYYKASLISGTFSGCTFTLTWGSDDGVTDPNDLTIGGSTTQSGTYNNLLGTSNGSTITSGPVTTLGFALLGSISGINPLPVELASFSAIIKDKSVVLNWKTSTEVTNYGFDIEKSQNSKIWEKIGFVQGAGNSNSPTEYSFTDKDLKSGSYSYRLKQIDNDGEYTFSKVVEINFGIPTRVELHQNYPNPFNPSTTIRINLPESGNVSLKIYNPIGEEVTSLINGFTEAGVYTLNFNAENLPTGIYIYQLRTNENTLTKKMLFLK